ncbi:class C sortase [Enterococcus canis]|nr:class C sortase [Enterococcus canis]
MKKNTKQLISKILMIVIFMVGSLITFYPFYSDALNNYLDQVMIAKYQREATQRNEVQRAKLAAANKKLQEKGGNPGADPFGEGGSDSANDAYFQDHLIGTINIPSINTEVPVFDTTNDKLLDRGATVLQGTSFPVGGESTHSVISAHRGLPNKMLFTDLPEVKKGDVFVLDILGEKLAYEVDQLKVVEPNETDELRIVPGEDLVTLLTCTPYMINSHRLLVRGHRVPYTEEVAATVEKGDQWRLLKQWLIIGGMILLLLLLLYLLYRSWMTYLLRKRKIDLVFYLQDPERQPIPGLAYTLGDKKGRPLKRDGQNYQAISDEAGQVRFENLPGGMYTIEETGHLAAYQPLKTMRAGLQKRKQKEPTFKLPTAFNAEVIEGPNREIILRPHTK